jgi:hypothetical protein
VLPAKSDQFAGSHFRSRHDHCVNGLAPLVVRNAENSGFENGNVLVQDFLDLGAIDVFTAGDDHVPGPVDQEHITLLIHVAHVTGAVPAVFQNFRGLFGLVPVTLHDVRATRHEFAYLTNRHIPAFLADDTDIDTDQRLSAGASAIDIE